MPDTPEQLYSSISSKELAEQNLTNLAQEASQSPPTERAPILYSDNVEVGGKMVEVAVHKTTPFSEVPEEAFQRVFATLNDILPSDMKFLTANIEVTKRGMEGRIDNEAGFERPRSLRARRAELYGKVALVRERIADIRIEQEAVNQQIVELKDKIVSTDSVEMKNELRRRIQGLEEQKRIIAENNKERLEGARKELQIINLEARLKDVITEQYLRGQQEITVQTEYGKVSAQSFHLMPPPETINDENRGLPPIVLIGGWGADAAGVENMAVELAYKGREVFFVGYPDSYGGEVPLEFAKATTQAGAEGLKPQAEFFIAAHTALLKIYGWDGDVEVWGHSAGSMLAAQMLNDKGWADRVDNAMLIAPAGTAEQSQLNQVVGYARNITRYLRNIRRLPSDLAKHSYVSGRRTEVNKKNPIRNRLHTALQKIVWNEGTLPHARTIQQDTYNGAKIGKGKIHLIHGGEDYATGAAARDNQYTPNNSKIEVHTALGMNHADFIMDPESVIEMVDKVRRGPESEQVQTILK
jgi:pimeloyl-ACP methyl ester carboxylesterase